MTLPPSFFGLISILPLSSLSVFRQHLPPSFLLTLLHAKRESDLPLSSSTSRVTLTFISPIYIWRNSGFLFHLLAQKYPFSLQFNSNFSSSSLFSMQREFTPALQFICIAQHLFFSVFAGFLLSSTSSHQQKGEAWSNTMRWIISDLSVLDDFEFKGRAEIFIIFFTKRLEIWFEISNASKIQIRWFKRCNYKEKDF